MRLHVSLSLYFMVISLPNFVELLDLSPPAKSFTDCQDCIEFPPNGSAKSLNDVRRLLIDKNHSKIIVGARNSVYRLDLSLTSPKQGDIADLTPSGDPLKECKQAKKEDCHNFIRLLLFDSQGDIFVCGTYAEGRGCWSFNRTGDLQPFAYAGSTDLLTPRAKNQNMTGIFAGDFLFTGLNVGDNLRRPIFSHSKIIGRPDIVQTIESDIVLKEANFVSSFLSDDNFIYIFLRETAVEDQAKAIYSRVARVCLYDIGVPSILPNKFSSFTKIRLSCSIPGDFPFNYDELQATYLSVNSKGSDGFVYGIFSTPELGVLGSAVCVYSFKRIKELFENSKYLEKDESTWKEVSPVDPDAGRPMCNSKLDTMQYKVGTATFAKGHSLLSGVAEPEPGKPLFVKNNVRFTQLVTDDVSVSGERTVYVMFIGTDNGTLYKVFTEMTQSATPFVVEQIQVFKEPEPIYSMTLYKGFVYIGSLSHVVRMPVERCDQYKSCRTCISARDPYCGWSNKKCVTKATAGNSAWEQDITNGNFAKICPEEPARCLISITQSKPGGTTVLLCQAEGIPVPKITSWKKDSLSVRASSRISMKQGPYPGSELLVISRFSVEQLGLYQCTVANELGENTCALSYTGGLPTIQFLGLVKVNLTSYISCRAEGIPKPRVFIYQITGKEKKLINAAKTPVKEMQGDRAYYCVAQNAFGPVAKALSVQERVIEAELKLTDETWSSDFLDSNSKGYRTVSANIETAVQQTYSRNPAFLGINKMTFRKGSVVAEMSLRFAAQESDSQVNLLQDLQDAVNSGRVGILVVDEDHVLNVNPDVTESTTEPQTGEGGLDRGLFAAGIITAILFSILIGFFLGVKFHSQAMGYCRTGAPGADATEGPSPKPVTGVSFMRSPSRIDTDPQGRQSQRKLVNHTPNGTEPNVDDEEEEDSDVSNAGKFTLHERTSSPTITDPPERRAPLANGEVVNV